MARAIVLILVAAAIAAGNPAWSGEPARFGDPIKADYESARDMLPLAASPPPPELAAGAEVVVISGYEPTGKRGGGTAVDVVVDRPKSKVLLVLTSYEKIEWRVTASPGTVISAIVASGYHPPTVTTKIETHGYLFKLPYATETESANFGALVASLGAAFAIDRVDAFRGSYRIPQTVTVSSLDPASPRLTARGAVPQAPSRKLSFDLLARDYSRVPWTLTGPASQSDRGDLQDGKLALDGGGKRVFKLTGDQLEVLDRATDRSYVATLPANFPRFSWAMDVAYDARREIATVVTLGGEGFLYRYDARRQQWIDFRSLNNVDIFALSYDPVADRYVAWTDRGELMFISADGDYLFSKPVASRLDGFGRLYDRGNARVPRLTPVPRGDTVALLYLQGGTVKRIWRYDVRTEKAELTY
ncbi:MAG TPA: hypothetical protein VF816_12070 [Rhodocyclaceae bacterium]